MLWFSDPKLGLNVRFFLETFSFSFNPRSPFHLYVIKALLRCDLIFFFLNLKCQSMRQIPLFFMGTMLVNIIFAIYFHTQIVLFRFQSIYLFHLQMFLNTVSLYAISRREWKFSCIRLIHGITRVTANLYNRCAKGLQIAMLLTLYFILFFF